jgi:hypothetical protein
MEHGWNQVNPLDGIEGYATYANAVKAVNKKLANAQAPICRVLIAVNAKGRFCPVAYNVAPHMLGALAAAGVMVVN